MPSYQILDNTGKVINTIVADLEYVQEKYPGKFQEIIYRSPTPPKIITKLSFRFRLSDAEYVGILTAAKTDVSVQAWVETFNMVNEVNLGDPRTKAGIDLLVSKNLLTKARGDAILNNPVLDSERF